MNKKKESKVVPNVRFKGFTDDWKQRKLGECFTERVESMPDGELISVTINDGIRKFSELGRHDNSNDDKSKYKKVCIGDIAYNSMRMWQGASGYSPYEGIVSPAYTVLSPNSGVNSKCLAYQFKLPGMIHTFQINSQGITSDNWNLKYPALSEIEIFVSTYEEEQAKIAEYFENFDRLITFHQQKITLLTKLKKAMLEKMFPKKGTVIPEFRFNGFANVWEQRKLNEVLSFLKDGTHGTHADDENGPLLLSAKNIKNGKIICDETDRRISEEEYEKIHTNFSLEVGDVLLTIVGSIGETAILKDCSSITFQRSVAFLRPNGTITSDFLYSEIQTQKFQNELDSRKSTSAQPGIYLGDLSEVPIVFTTNLDEQTKIGDYFNNLDHLITLHHRKIDKIKNMKKAMLDQMFIY